MGEALKCDRCGTLYESNFQSYLRSYYICKDNHPYVSEKIDLCPMCQKDLERWFTYPTRIKKEKEE